jgi:uncharacterized protein
MRVALILIALAITMPVWAADRPVPPKPVRWVTDRAALLSTSTKSALDSRLEAYEHQTGHQVIVWIEPTLGAEALEEWTQRVFTAWGIGRTGNDDGVALFVFPTDRTMRIEVGYGLEEKLPDLLAARIMDEVMRPELLAGHGDAAITNGVDQILARIGPDAEAAKVAPVTLAANSISWIWILLGTLAVIGLVFVCATHPNVAWFLFDIIQTIAIVGGSSGGSSRGGGGFSGGGGRSGGGGASSSW